MRVEALQARVVMLVDFDYFYAQCEEVRNPSLKDKPVVVCMYSGRTEDSGAVSTSNYIARKYGVKSGLPIFLAKRKLKDVDAVFLPVDRVFYLEVSGRIMAILRSYADHFEQAGIDEAYLEVSKRVRGDFEEAKGLAQKIKEDVKVQEKITCSIGIGPNKLVAKIAADIQKPDGLTVVKPENVEGFLAPLPVGSILGVGVKTEKKMEDLGIRTVNDLVKYDYGRLIDVFGKNFGTYLHDASKGLDYSLVQERGEAESISRIATLKEDTRNLEVILENANQLCDDLFGKLILRELGFKSVGIIAVMKDMSVHSRSRTFENSVNESMLLKKSVKELFERLLNESEIELRRIGVKISSFVEGGAKQEQMTDFIEPSKG